MHLNHYLSLAGLASRRKAADLIKSGKISINNFIVKDPAYLIKETDVVRYKKRIVKPEEKLYILLNKPQGYVTTTSDEQGRKTVIDLLGNATKKRLFPIGRLDKETAGLIIMTNDGELAQKLSHPRYEIKKVYQVVLDKPLTIEHAHKLRKGLRLRDGIARIDALSFPEVKNKKIVRISLHSGKKRIIRRIFEHLDYKVSNLDRINYANLTQKRLNKGSWRYLNEKEIEYLKKLSATE
jgi:23S rRNA pseudouridine2605 synthase